MMVQKFKKSRLSWHKQEQLIEYFISGSKDKVVPDSIVYSDSWKAYNALDISEVKHMRITHSKQFANKQNPINGIENL